MPLPQQCNRRQAIRALATACVGGTLAALAQAQAGAATIHFYSPETNINNFGTLKSEFDTFFAGVGGHKFQPYGDRAAFERAMAGNNNGLFLLSSWHYPQLANRAAWQPVLIGRLKDKSTQRHVLCSRQNITALAGLKGAKLASAGNKAFTLNLLAELLGPEHRALITEQNVLPVPKDVDALMTMALGEVQAAVATESGLERLAKTNAKQYRALTQLAKGPERLLPIVVAPAAADASCQALLQILAGMGADPEGQQRLRLLGFDALTAITDVQRKALRP